MPTLVCTDVHADLDLHCLQNAYYIRGLFVFLWRSMEEENYLSGCSSFLEVRSFPKFWTPEKLCRPSKRPYDAAYCIWANYRTRLYKGTVKQFYSLQITSSVLLVYFFIKAYVVGTHLNCTPYNFICFFKFLLNDMSTLMCVLLCIF